MEHRVNNAITAKKVIVVDMAGVNRGEISIEDLGIACRKLGCDAIQMNDAPVPVVKLGDYKKFLFDMKKKENHKKKSQVEVKQICFSTNISENDMNTKIAAIRRILSEGDSVEALIKSDNARDPDARIRNLGMAFDTAKKIQGILSQEKNMKVTPVVKQERAAKFFVNNSSKN